MVVNVSDEHEMRASTGVGWRGVQSKLQVTMRGICEMQSSGNFPRRSEERERERETSEVRKSLEEYEEGETKR